MNITDEKQSEVPSNVRDLRDVPLSDVSDLDRESIIRRLLPETPVERVPVARFNSSI